jgi:hypothetical protein
MCRKWIGFNNMRDNTASVPSLRSTRSAFLSVAILALSLLALSGIGVLAQGQAGPTSPVVIDHDPMGVTVGNPTPVVGTSPGPHPRPPVGEVVPDSRLNQILIERTTPVTVTTGNRTPTSERLSLQCYVGGRQTGGMIRLRRLREGVDGDYSLARQTVGLLNGRATFFVRFHRRLLRHGRRLLSGRKVYLVTTKAAGHVGQNETGSIQTVTVLNDDPAAFPGGVGKE